MANVYKNVSQGTLKLKDGGAGPSELTISGLKGGISWSVIEERVAVMSRNTPIAWAKKKLQPVEVSFDVHYKEWAEKSTASSGATTSFRDFMRGQFTGYVSPGDGGDPEFIIELTVDDSSATGDENEVFTFNNCVLEESSFEENEDINSISFKCKALLEPSVSRS